MLPFVEVQDGEVIDHRTYVATNHRCVALCVVRSERYGLVLRFYKWVMKTPEKGWKVDLARFQVGDIDLCALASDAIELASKHGIHLGWASLDRVRQIDVAVQTVPMCPCCEKSDRVTELQTDVIWECGRCGNAFW
jgi:ribosomal protein L37AE/L43A